MKFTSSISARSERVHRNERGFLIIAMMAILAIILIYVAASMRSLTHLRKDLKLVEQKQVQRLAKPSAVQTTNATAAVTSSIQ